MKLVIDLRFPVILILIIRGSFQNYMLVKAMAFNSGFGVPYSFEDLGSRIIVSPTPIPVLDKHSYSAYDTALKQREYKALMKDMLRVDILCMRQGWDERTGRNELSELLNESL